MPKKKQNPVGRGRPRLAGGPRRGCNLYLPEKLIDRLRREADREHRSLSDHIAYLLTRKD